MRDEAWFQTRGKKLYRSFLLKLAQTITRIERLDFDPKSISIAGFIEHQRMELKSLPVGDMIAILTQQKYGILSISYLFGMGYVVTFNSGDMEWQTIDDSYEDAIQRMFDQVNHSKEVVD